MNIKYIILASTLALGITIESAEKKLNPAASPFIPAPDSTVTIFGTTLNTQLPWNYSPHSSVSGESLTSILDRHQRLLIFSALLPNNGPRIVRHAATMFNPHFLSNIEFATISRANGSQLEVEYIQNIQSTENILRYLEACYTLGLHDSARVEYVGALLTKMYLAEGTTLSDHPISASPGTESSVLSTSSSALPAVLLPASSPALGVPVVVEAGNPPRPATPKALVASSTDAPAIAQLPAAASTTHHAPLPPADIRTSEGASMVSSANESEAKSTTRPSFAQMASKRAHNTSGSSVPSAAKATTSTSTSAKKEDKKASDSQSSPRTTSHNSHHHSRDHQSHHHASPADAKSNPASHAHAHAANAAAAVAHVVKATPVPAPKNRSQSLFSLLENDDSKEEDLQEDVENQEEADDVDDQNEHEEEFQEPISDNPTINATQPDISTASKTAANRKKKERQKKKNQKRNRAAAAALAAEKERQDHAVLDGILAERTKIIDEVTHAISTASQEAGRSSDNPLLQRMIAALRKNPGTYVLRFLDSEKDQEKEYKIALAAIASRIAKFKSECPSLHAYLAQDSNDTQTVPAIADENITTREGLLRVLAHMEEIATSGRSVKILEITQEELAAAKQLFKDDLSHTVNPDQFRLFLETFSFDSNDLPLIDHLTEINRTRFNTNSLFTKIIENLRQRCILYQYVDTFTSHPSIEAYNALRAAFVDNTNRPHIKIRYLEPLLALTYPPASIAKQCVDFAVSAPPTHVQNFVTTLQYNHRHFLALDAPTLRDCFDWCLRNSFRNLTCRIPGDDIVTAESVQVTLTERISKLSAQPLCEQDINNMTYAWTSIICINLPTYSSVAGLQDRYAQALLPVLEKQKAEHPHLATNPQFLYLCRLVQLALDDIPDKERTKICAQCIRAVNENPGLTDEAKNHTSLSLLMLTYRNTKVLRCAESKALFTEAFGTYDKQSLSRPLTDNPLNMTQVPIATFRLRYDAYKKENPNSLPNILPFNFVTDEKTSQAIRALAEKTFHEHNISDAFTLLFYLTDVLHYLQNDYAAKVRLERRKNSRKTLHFPSPEEGIDRVKRLYKELPLLVQIFLMYYEPEMCQNIQLQPKILELTVPTK